MVNDLATIRAHVVVDTVVANSAGLPNDASQGDFKFDGDVTINNGSTLSVASGGVVAGPPREVVDPSRLPDPCRTDHPYGRAATDNRGRQ